MLRVLDRSLGNVAYRLWDFKEGGVRLREQKLLEQQSHWPAEQLRRWQEQRFDRLVRHAYASCDWYKRQIKQRGIALDAPLTLDSLSQFPVTTKLDIRNNLDDFISSRYAKADLASAKTGGSTGVALNLYLDRHCQKLRNGAQLYADAFSGWRPGARIAAIWGNPPVPGTLKQKLRAFLLERTVYLDTMEINPESLARFVAEWREFRPDLIFGHAHSIYVLASYLLDNEITDLRPEGIVATSMMLLDRERAAIEQAFGCRVSNRYGCEEVGLIAVECERHQGMHINSPHIILECLDDRNQPLPPGQPGRLAITDLNNLGMPLIRYRVEDVGVLATAPCSCGRTLPLLAYLEGRVADFLKKPDGGRVAGVSLVERTLTKVPGIEQMQLIQEDLHEIVINRVKASDYTLDTDRLLLEEFRQVFGDSTRLTIRDVDRISQEKSGKYRFSICRI